MSNVIYALIGNVNNVTEECIKNARTIKNIIPFDRFNNIINDESPTLLRYAYGIFSKFL